MASMGNAQRGALGGLAKLGEGTRTTSDLSRVGGGLSRGANEGKKLNAAPWSDTFPAAGATLDLDFANNRGFVRGVGQGGVMDAITFTRASNGTFVKPNGTLSTHANQGALGLNLLTFPQDFDNVAWTKSNSRIVAKAVIAPDGTLSGSKVIATANNGSISQSTASWPSNTASIIDLQTGLVTSNVAGTWTSLTTDSLPDGWWRIKATVDSRTYSVYAKEAEWGYVALQTFAGQVYLYPYQNSGSAGTADNNSGIFIWGAQLEVGSTATEYFPTNIGEPRFDWASTDSTGAGTIADPRVIPLRANPTSNGILIEEVRTNRLLWNRDATQTQWVKTNITAVKDQTGIDGVANAASSLTATDDNGTCIQTITLAAGNRTGSVYLKRLTGTGLIQVTLDGSTYSTVELSDTEWYRIVLSGSVTNPTVGIKIAVDGDAVAMDYGQVEDGLFATSPILTTTATATRALDASSVSIENSSAAINSRNGAIRVDFTPLSNQSAGVIFRIGDATNQIDLYNVTAGFLGMRLRSRNINYSDSNGLNNAIIANKKNVISASWSSRKLIRASNAGVSDERTGVFSPDINNNQFATITANNSTNARITYFPKELTFDSVKELAK
jgi:hypothetical protein